jgi:DNA-directed RNA polymerase specialized sigma24 family protein
MAENRVRALHRAESSPRRDRRRHDPNPVEQRELSDDEPEPVVRIIDGELLAEIRRQLGDVLCQVHDLRCEGLDWAHIGAQLDLTPNALRNRYERAVARLRRDLGIG